MVIKSIIFDMDGVLVDSERFYHQKRMVFFENINYQPASFDLSDYVGLSESDGWKLAIPDENDRKDIVPLFEPFSELNKINYSEYLNEYVREFLGMVKEDGKILAIASASPIADIKQMMNQCDLNNFFDAIVSGEEVSNNKPNPDIYFEALRRLQLQSDEAIVIEDSYVGIKAAKSAGIETWAVIFPTYSIDQSQADAIFNGFEEISDYYLDSKRKS